MEAATRTGQRIGYKRVSTATQNTDRQLDGIAPPLDRVFEDKVSGKSKEGRLGLAEMIAYARAGDTIIVHSLDRLARNLVDLRGLVDQITKKGVCLVFVKENLTFKSVVGANGGAQADPMSTLLLNMLGAVAEFERAIIVERVREGVAIAHAAGKFKGGAPKFKGEQVAQLRAEALAAGPYGKAGVARKWGISRSTLHAYLKRG